MFWDATLFADDGVTPLLGTVDGSGNVTQASFSTDPVHPRPFLEDPEGMFARAVDFMEGRATITAGTLVILDKRTDPVRQESGLLTSLLADAAGESALNGRRILLQRREGATRTTVIDGVISGASLNDDWSSFSCTIRDQNERARKTRAFTTTAVRDAGGVIVQAPTMLPRGALAGYGKPRADAPESEWLVPPTTPLTAIYTGGNFDLRGMWISGSPWQRDGNVAPAALALSQAMRDALVPEVIELEPYQEEVAPGEFQTVRPYRYLYRNVSVLWRPTTGGAWRELRAPAPLNSALVATSTARIDSSQGPDATVAWGIAVGEYQPRPGQTEPDARPTEGQSVEVVIAYIGPASEDYPFVYEGTQGEFLLGGYRGDYSDTPPQTRLDEAAFLAIDTPARVLQTEPVDDWKAWAEKVWKAIGGAAPLNAAGQVSPVIYETPTPDEVLFELNEDNTSEAEWGHDDSEAVNRVTLSYPRDTRTPAEVDPDGEGSNGLGLTSVNIPITIQKEGSASLQLLGERVWDLGVLPSLRAIGGVRGEVPVPEVLDDTGGLLAAERGHQALDRLLFGGQTIHATCLRSATSGLQLGDWVLVDLPWLPNYTTGERGGQRVAQVVGIQETDDLTRSFDLLDGGPTLQPIAPPTLGALSVTDAGVVSIPVTSVPTDGEVVVAYALTAAADPAPAEDGPDWKPLPRVAAVSTVRTPALPAGMRAWVHARIRVKGRRASDWSTPVSIVIPSVARVRGVSVTIGPDGSVQVAGTASAEAEGVRIYYDAHDPSVDAVLSAFADFDADALPWVLPITARPGEQVSVEVEGWTGWDGASVTGVAGRRIATAATRPSVDASYDVFNIHLVDGADAVTCDQGALVQEVWGSTAVFVGGIPRESMIEALEAAAAPLWGRTPGQLPVTMPDAGQITGVYLRSVVMRGAVALDTGYHLFWIYGTPAPLAWKVEASEGAGTGTLTAAVLDDPRGVVSLVRFWLLDKGVKTGPLAATTTGSGTWAYTFALDPKHPIVLQAELVRSDGAPSEWAEPATFDFDKVAMPDVPALALDGSGTAHVTVNCTDTDIATGAGGLQSRLDGGVWTGRTVDPVTRIATWDETQTDAVQLLEVRGINLSGVPGPVKQAKIPAFTAPPGASASITSALVQEYSPGTCSPAVPLVNRITVTFANTSPGDTWSLRRFEDGKQAEAVASGIPVETTTYDDSIATDSTTGSAVVDVAYLITLSGVSAWTQTLKQRRAACP